MKRKIVTSLLILIVAIICCGCGVETRQKTITKYTNSETQYEEEEVDLTPTVYITKYGERYHRFGCTHAKNLYLKLTVKEATKRGYTACYYCCD